MPQYRPGTQLRSTVCDTEIVVVRPPSRDVDVTCGGAPMVEKDRAGEPTGSPDPDLAAGTELGKRYVHDGSGLEVLCTHPGAGSVAVDGEVVTRQASKPLPASD